MSVHLFLVPEWQERGLCQQVDPDLFYPERGESPEPAKSICGDCEVKQDCLQWSLDRREPYGVWGGVSEPERRRILRSRDQPTAPLGCTAPGCGRTRRNHKATDHAYQVPDMNTVLDRARELKNRRPAA